MGEFTYLPYIVVYTFVIFFIIVIFIAKAYDHLIYKEKDQTRNGRKLSSFESFFISESIENSYLTNFHNDSLILLLLFWRLLCFCFFIGIVLAWSYVNSGGNNAPYFTLWNLDLISLYYFIATIYSFIGNIYHPIFKISKLNEGTTEELFFSSVILFGSHLHQILFEVAGATALFVTIIDFVALDHKFRFFNINEHFMTSMSFLIEMILSRQTVRWEHLILNLSWALLYLVFIWPMVRFGACSEWPYFFLETDSTNSFIWIIILIVVDIFFYTIWWLIGYLRDTFLFKKEILPLISSQNHETELPPLRGNF